MQNSKIKKLLEEKELVEQFYEMLEYDDYAETVIKLHDLMKKHGAFPEYQLEVKSETSSILFRGIGNECYKKNLLQGALKFYNRAIGSAPSNSVAMVLAYSNRSVVFYNMERYTACLKDIETCIEMGCPKEVLKKLRKRQRDCQQNLWKENVANSEDELNVFKEKLKSHPQIPSVTDDVEISINPTTKIPIVVAARDIKIGTVIGIETAFSVFLNDANNAISCYYCHRLSLNLIPCPSCCTAMFCDNECKMRSMAEGHKLECKIMDVIDTTTFGPYIPLTLRTVFKIKALSNWKQFAKASLDIGTERMKNSPVNEIFDGNFKFCMLNFFEKMEFKFGMKYNLSFYCAIIIERLLLVPSFFPSERAARDEAVRAMARMIMKLHLLLFNRIEINNVGIVTDENHSKQFIVDNYGYFGFASKLKHSCEANILQIGLNRRIGLIAAKPIKKGDELTISLVQHSYLAGHNTEKVRGRLFELYRLGEVCRCLSCSLKDDHVKPPALTREQKEIYYACAANLEGMPALKVTCEAMTRLQDKTDTIEYQNLFKRFIILLSSGQFAETKNYLPCNCNGNEE